MNSKLFKLCLSAILALSFNACGGDSNDDDNGGGGNDTVKCNAGDVICNPAGTGLLVCNAAGNGYDNGDSCDLGCENNACKKDNDGPATTVCEANKKECKNNQILTCKADGSGYLNDVDECPYGCENGASECLTQKCTNGQTKCSSDGSSVETCNADGGWDSSACPIGCDGGHCVEIPSYDACSAADLEDCLSRIENAGYDRTDGVCLIEDGEVGCYLGKCNVPNTSKIECNAEYGAMMVSVCSPIGNDGSGVWELVDIDEECVNGCKEDLSACAEPLVPDQGADCDASRADRCDGEILSYCDDGTVVAGKCGNGRSCVELDKSGSVWADCYDPDETCTEDSVSCNVESTWLGDYASVVEYSCLSSKADPNKKYPVRTGEEECVSGECAADGISCEPALVDDLYKDCTPESRASRCDDDVFSFCSWDEDYQEGYVMAADCVEYDYDLCTTVNGTVSCYNTCDSENTVEQFCYYDDEYEGFVIGTNSCVKDDAGTTLVTKKALTKLCASGCNATKDGCAYEQEGQACTADMGESCVDNTAVYCGSSGRIGAENCPGLYGENMICYINNDDESWCAESCADGTVGSIATECVEMDLGIFVIAYQTSKKCVATKDGKQVYEGVEGSTAYCDDQGCNAAGTACIAVDDE